jgi:tRNA(adenine34) deaminase
MTTDDATAPSALPASLDDEAWMRIALAEADAATGHGDVPVGAVVVAADGR